jgi:hypothetical protein
MDNFHQNDWRRLCELVVREKDPDKLQELLEQLTSALNRRARNLIAPPGAPASGRHNEVTSKDGS